MRDITDTSFSDDLVRGSPDMFINRASIAVAALPAVAVPGQRLCDLQSDVEIVVEADTDLVIAATPLVVKLQKSATKDGVYTDAETLYTSPTTSTVNKGVIFRRTLPVGDDYFYKAVATSIAGNTGTLSVFPHQVKR